MQKLFRLLTFAIALACSFQLAAQTPKPRAVTEGPDFSRLPSGTYRTGVLTLTEERGIASIRTLDPKMGAKLERQLKRTPKHLDRLNRLYRNVVEQNELIDLSEINVRKGIGDRKIRRNNIFVRDGIFLMVQDNFE